MRDYDDLMRETDRAEAKAEWWDEFMPDWREREADHEDDSTRERNDR